MQRIDEGSLRTAFGGLRGATLTRYHRMEQFDGEGRRIAFKERTIRSTDGELQVTASDSSGEFDFGYLARFVSPPGEPTSLEELPDNVLPDDPAYASARNVEAFRYELVSDTTLHGRRVRLVRIAARPGPGDGQSIRRAELFLEQESDRLVGVQIDRTDSALWFREESSLFVSVDRLPSGRWVPEQARFETRITVPFRPEQTFRSVIRYSDYGNAV